MRKNLFRFVFGFVICTIFLVYSNNTSLHAIALNFETIPDDHGGYTVVVKTMYKGIVNVNSNNGGYAQFNCDGKCKLVAGKNYFKAKKNEDITIEASPVLPMYNDEGEPIYSVLPIATSIYYAEQEQTEEEANHYLGSYDDPKDVEQPQKADAKQKEIKKSSNSSFSSLQIDKGKLTPPFKAGITSYKVTLDNTVTQLKVTAKAVDRKSSISGDGKQELKQGKNTIKMKCIAEDGSETTYTILAYVSEEPLTTLNYQDKELGVIRMGTRTPTLSKAFKKINININGIETDAWKKEAADLTLLYLQHDKTKDFYIYDEKKQSVLSIYKPMTLLGTDIIMIDVPAKLQSRKGMRFTEVEIDHQMLPGWTFHDQALKNYALIYIMDEAGIKKYYQYEKTEQRLQLYSGAASISQEAYDRNTHKEEQLLYIIYGLSAGCLLILASAGYFYYKARAKSAS